MASDSEESTYSDHSLDLDPDIEIETVSRSLIKFSTELYLALKMRPNHSTNLVCSPLFVSSMIAALKSTALGITAEEIMKHVFPGVDNNHQLEIGLQAILDSLQEEGDDKFFTLTSPTCLFLQKRMDPKDKFIQDIKRCFKMDMVEFDYAQDDWEVFSDVVKKWALRSTNNQIGSIFRGLPGIDIDPHGFRLIPISLVLFMGNWLHPFDRNSTELLPFFVDEHRSANVPMMKSTVLRNIMYGPMRKLDCQAVVLPYKGGRLCLVLFIPNERSGLSKIELKLETIFPKAYFEEMRVLRKKLDPEAGVRITLPKFTIESTIDLAAPLQELGIDLLFKKGRGEYSPFVDNVSEVHVSQIWQKVVFQVNETGNEKHKSSSTVKGEPRPSSQCSEHSDSRRPSTPPEMIEIVADHPFYFQVVDMKLDVLILSGCCKNPLIKDFTQNRYSNFVREYHSSLPTSDVKSAETTSNSKKPKATDRTNKSLLCDMEFEGESN